MSEVLLFDLFGVIARQQSAAGWAELERLVGVPGLHPLYWGRRHSYDRGDLKGADYWRLVAEELGTRFDDGRVAALIAADIASWSAVDAEMVALVERLVDEGRRVALLSNIPEELAAHYEAAQPWLARLELVAFSCRIGHAKPEAGAFEWCARALDAAPQRILFVDDNAGNIDAAAALGFRTRLFTGIDGLNSSVG
ncbi:HAD superfamily hydrolase [Virgisporangium aliadipatigenens]|uniref:HAD superfamily hydrolase n=1 Tax=Virgisporangium aliadipatigenens TaxID=741659 RepID=A0A8J3YIW5_9ACTN|nr:HAD family phosphatase [Virgisporangium aliadipatigenens]GIJ45242.1 HAD superfamily hydrolase [Virgisporangium aliadipatigenens]